MALSKLTYLCIGRNDLAYCRNENTYDRWPADGVWLTYNSASVTGIMLAKAAACSSAASSVAKAESESERSREEMTALNAACEKRKLSLALDICRKP
jgi:hypothetical protein